MGATSKSQRETEAGAAGACWKDTKERDRKMAPETGFHPPGGHAVRKSPPPRAKHKPFHPWKPRMPRNKVQAGYRGTQLPAAAQTPVASLRDGIAHFGHYFTPLFCQNTTCALGRHPVQ